MMTLSGARGEVLITSREGVLTSRIPQGTVFRVAKETPLSCQQPRDCLTQYSRAPVQQSPPFLQCLPVLVKLPTAGVLDNLMWIVWGMLSAALMDVPIGARGQEVQDHQPHLQTQDPSRVNHNLFVNLSNNNLANLPDKSPGQR